ncbi:MAG: sigma-70 family RNA polymerase sigma factor [Deltaproteobacteria bacterium]|nr:sigma-70 family RNA polymerase sigma factor [Deltaproteobacteria bacterium]MBW2136791.1 sigma-70 family RNA polymerase sigma factor [Deltaproteobacteria bacterium]
MDEDTKRPPGSAQEDATWVRAFQEGDRTAFDRLVLKHKDRLFNLCYRFLGDYQEANDSAQEAFISAYRALKKFRFESAFSTWLYRIAVNTCKNKLKSSAYRKERVTVSLDNPRKGANPSVNIGDESRSPAVELARKERMAQIQGAINRLAQEHREVVVLRDINGLSYEEIGDITGLNPGTVKSRIARGRLELRKMLRDVI